MTRDERYCDHCEADTPHDCRDSDHERDGSGDWRKCLACGWEYGGLAGRYEPPGECWRCLGDGTIYTTNDEDGQVAPCPECGRPPATAAAGPPPGSP